MLYALAIGLVLGRLLGGRFSSLGRVQFRFAAVAIVGLWIQLALFSAPITAVIGDLGPPLYVGSTVVVLGAVLVNVLRIPGLLLVLLGALSNLAAIVANGGYMPATQEALAGRMEAVGYSNSVQLASPALEPLIDRYALPTALPFSNVFSLGDVFIGLGVIVVIVMAMVRPSSTAPDMRVSPLPPTPGQRASLPR
jgi:hypothetical protein